MRNEGSISILVLVMGVVMSITIGGLALFGSVEYTNARRNEAYEKAISVAEAGVYYYRWHLAHDPEDYFDGTGQPGVYEHEYLDPQGASVGRYRLTVTPPDEGSEVVTVKSVGWTNEFSNIKRTVTAKFGPETLTKFSFLHNANAWFGQGITVYGEVFSNGGIRMDGINQSIVRSAKATYTCGTETGCWPSQNKPGVWGSGGPSDLWEYPVPTFDFNGVVTDFSAMKTAAQTTGVYLPHTSSYGYHLVFYADGSVRVYRVTKVNNLKGDDGNNCVNLYQGINRQTLIGTYQLTDKKIFYAEDPVWVEGTVKGKATVVAARLPVNTYSTDMWIYDNVLYDVKDGSTSLGLIAQNDVIFARNIPNDFEIDAALMAQSGRVIRHDYNYWYCATSSYAIRNKLTIYGSVISSEKSYWNYSSGSTLISGFHDRDITFNQDSSELPPPYFPTYGSVKILSWEEDAN